MNIVGIDKVPILPKDAQKLEKYGTLILHNDLPNEEEGTNRIKDADIAIINWFCMTPKVISGAPKLKMICISAIGYESVDILEAKKKNIIVSNCPGYCVQAVAEHTIGLMLNALRLTSKAEQSLREGKFNPMEYKGKELKGATLGIIGYGHVGKKVAEIVSKGFDARILFINTSSQRQDFEKLLRESDIICVSLPLNERTKGFLGRNEFSLMKDGVVIINTSRGATIDENVFVENLKSRKIFAAGLDVIADEPMRKDNPLLLLPNVTITPHIAFNTDQSERALSKMVADNIIAFIKERPQNVVS